MSTIPDRIHVLHVDDEPDLTGLVADFLEREDDRISVTTATSANAGLDFLAHTDVDCVISDYDMPGKNGIEFLETVREDWSNLPFILYTGKGSEAVAGEAISAGVTDYLQKESGTEQYRILANRVVNAVERYRATQHIERQNDLFRQAQDIATVGVWEYDTGTEMFYNSEEVLEIHGLSPDEDMSAEKSFGYYHPDDQPLIRNAFQQAIEEGESYDLKLRLFDDDGNLQWVRTQGEPQTENGDIVRVRGTIQDITDQKKREQNLEQFKKAAENAGHAVYVTDSEGTIEYVNPAFEQITGYATEEALGKNPRILQSGEMSEGYYEELWESVLAGEIWEEDVVNRRKNGDLYYAHQTIAPIRDENDEIEAFVAIQTDISERKEERERLEFLELLGAQLTELASDLLQIDQKSTESKINEALETIGTLVDADRSYVFQIDHDEETLSNTHEWTAECIEPQIDMLQDIPEDTFPWWMEKLENHETLTIPAVSSLPPEANAEQEILQEQDITSLIVAPMISEGELIGFIGFDWVDQQDAWSEDFIHILQITGEILSSAIERESRRRELKRREAYLEQSSDIISVMNSDGEVTYQSASTERATGFSPADIIGDSGFEHVHPDDRENLREAFLPFVSQPNTEVQEELRIETKNGDWRWIEVRGVNKLNDPVIEGLLFSSRDITERKKREREIQQLHERLELAVEGAELGVWDWDMTTDEVEFNEQWAAMLGYSLDEIEPHLCAWEKRVHPDDLAEVEAALDAHIDNETNYYDTEHRMQTADGAWKWVRDVGKIFDRNEDGEPIRAVGIHIDIDERKTYEQTLEQERDIFSQGPSIVFQWADEEGWPVEYVSENVEAVFGYSADDFTSGNISYAEIIHDDDLDRVIAEVAENSDEGTERFSHEPYRVVRADGDIRWVLDHTKNVWENGAITHRLGYIVDITEQKNRERELKERNQQLDRFASVVSHDLRNPLKVATGRLELARDECDTPHYEQIETALNRIETIIDDTLTLSRLGDTIEETQEIDLKAHVNKCWDGVETGACTLDPVAEARQIHADPDRLQHVFENLFRNAVEHGGEGVTVSVDLLEDGFAVNDDGPGLPDDLDVFETGETTSTEGAGFGLSIVDEIVTAHGWEIQATESEAGGARFEITGVEFVAE